MGNEMIARAIHQASSRSSRAFVTINSVAIPPSLMASELFGHERGAFSGTLQRRHGKSELAGASTTLLDEVGELSANTQVALLPILLVVRNRARRGNRPLKIDVPVIAATNRDLQAVDEKNFRSDLFY
jgi:formate hydrogenlyase transcriptional activator